MRVVLDTNVLVSGIFFGGIPAEILDAWTDDKFLYCAQSVNADYWGTGDNDLRVLQEACDYKIIQRKGFLS